MRVPDDVEAVKKDAMDTAAEQDDVDAQDEELDELDAVDDGDEAVIQKPSKL